LSLPTFANSNGARDSAVDSAPATSRLNVINEPAAPTATVEVTEPDLETFADMAANPSMINNAFDGMAADRGALTAPTAPTASTAPFEASAIGVDPNPSFIGTQTQTAYRQNAYRAGAPLTGRLNPAYGEVNPISGRAYNQRAQNLPHNASYMGQPHGINYMGISPNYAGIAPMNAAPQNFGVRRIADGDGLTRYDDNGLNNGINNGAVNNGNTGGATNINTGNAPNTTAPGSGIMNISDNIGGSVVGHIPGQVYHHGWQVHSDVRGTRFEEAAEVLGALGIMVGDEGGFRPNDTIIRSEASKIAVYMLGLTNIAGGTTTRFPDVPAGHWASGVINVADTQGMVIGYEDRTFRPDNNITFAEAVTIIVRTLGFEPAAEAAGGFPTGYLVIASQQGLLRGVQGASNEPARRGDVAQLVYNALNANMMTQTGFGTNVTYEVVNRTILESRLDTERGVGQISANSETRITGPASLRVGEVEIDDEIFNVGNTPAENLLGFTVVYYARISRNTDERTLLIVRPEANRNHTISVNSSYIASVTGTIGERLTFSYWVNRATDRDPRRATIAANATLILNGRYEPLANITILHPTSGNVTLLDTTGSGEYDIVFVNQFRNVVVEDVSTTTGRVTDKYGNPSLVFDTTDTNSRFSIIRDGRLINISDLREWDVLSVTTSRDRELIRAFVSTASVEGTVTETSTVGGVTRFTINGREFELAENLLDIDYDIRLQTSGVFFLDIEGRIAAVDTRARVGEHYVYLVDMGEVGTFERRAQFKIFTATGDTLILNGATRMRLNDNYSLTAEQILSRPELSGGMGTIRQLVTVEQNARGELTGITTAHNPNATATVMAPTPVRDRFTLNYHGNLTFTSSNNRLGPVRVDANTVVFDIPAGAGTDTTLFSVRGMNMFSNNSSYDVYIYDLTEDFIARAIVVTSTTGITAADAPIAVVDRITRTHNPEMAQTDRLHAFQNGQAIDFLAADTNVLRKGAVPLEQGDIIQFRTNARGEIDGITVLFDVRSAYPDAIHRDTMEIKQVGELTLAFGRVTRRFPGSVNVSINDVIYNFSTNNVHVYEFDSTRTTNRVRVVTAGDIPIYEAPDPDVGFAGNQWYLFVKQYRGVTEEMVIIR